MTFENSVRVKKNDVVTRQKVEGMGVHTDQWIEQKPQQKRGIPRKKF